MPPIEQTLPFADFNDPRRSLYRRMQGEGQAEAPPLPPVGGLGPQPASSPPPQTDPRFGRQFSPQDRLRQRNLLIELLRKRDSAQP